MNTNDTHDARQLLTRELASYLVRRLGGGGSASRNVGDCFLQTTVMDLTHADGDADRAEEVESAHAEQSAAGGSSEGLRLLDPAPSALSGPQPHDPAAPALDDEDAAEFEPYNAFQSRRASRRALLIDLNGLGCLAGPAEGWTPEVDPWLDLPTQVRLREAGMRPPEDGLPLWWTRMDTSIEAEQVASTLVSAFLDALGIPPVVVAADLGCGALERFGGPARAATRASAPFRPTSTAQGIVEDPEAIRWDYAAHLLLRRAAQVADWPRPAGSAAAYFALVDELDHDAIKELVALAPAGPGASHPAWFRRCRNGWVADPTLPRRMARTAAEEPLCTLTRGQALELEQRLRF